MNVSLPPPVPQPQPLPYGRPSSADGDRLGAAIARVEASAAVAAAVLKLLRAVIYFSMWGRSPFTLPGRPLLYSLPMYALVLASLAQVLLLIGAIGWFVAQRWAVPVVLIAPAGWVVTVGMDVLGFLGRVVQEFGQTGGWQTRAYPMAEAVSRLSEVVLPLLLAWLVFRFPGRRSA